MAAIALFVYFACYAVLGFFPVSGAVEQIIGILLEMVWMVCFLNISLGVFNLIPIPPLDGSKVLFSFLPARAFNFILNFERYGFLILVIVLFTGILDVPIGILMNWVYQFLYNVIIWPFTLLGLL